MVRVVHYLNQFFGGLGGEDKAGMAPVSELGPVGTGRGLTRFLGGDDRIVGTVVGGDNYMAQGGSGAVEEVVGLISRFDPDVVVAGPAFGSGRYGLACGAVCAAVIEQLGVPALTGLHPDSPGAAEYRSWVPILATAETAAGMGAALERLAPLASRLARGEALGSAAEEGTLTKGLRRNTFEDVRGSTRAIDMLLAKMRGESFTTEWPLPSYEPAEASEPISSGASFRLALVTEAGIVPAGNPDRLPSGWATDWMTYPIQDRDGFAEGEFESVHGGIDTSFANQDPDRQVPLDAARSMEQAGRLSLHPDLLSTTGNMGTLRDMTRIGAEMGRALIADGVQAVIVGST
ncbi:MAG: glycine/betaine/sarcosine/D-proline family reductase selenoprotein B [Acidimicrobiia bacterium]|nr:glycine/betaine/sarcosine/D-proline family reductase selenoprotein B [Acidimicrobiia bacterium]